MVSEESGVTYRRHVSHLQRIDDEPDKPTITEMDTSETNSSSMSTSCGIGSKRPVERERYGATDTESRTKRAVRQPTYLREYV